MFDSIVRIISEQLNIAKSDIDDRSRIMDDLGADSLDVVEMLMAIEEFFGCVVPDEDVEQLETVGDVVEYVENCM